MTEHAGPRPPPGNGLPLAPPRPQRVDGAARLAVGRDATGASRIVDLYQRAPARLLFPREPGPAPTAVLVTTSGGLTGGDRLALDLVAGDGAALVATSQAAERIYRCEDGAAAIRIGLSVADGASLDWLMQETILFDGARLARRTEAEVAPSARLLAVESVVFGRRAMGETFADGLLHDVWRVRRAGRLVWADGARVGGAAERALPFGHGDAAGTATILLVAPDADAWRAPVRALSLPGVEGGASAFDGILVVRLLARDASALRGAVVAVTNALRGRPLPRVWSC